MRKARKAARALSWLWLATAATAFAATPQTASPPRRDSNLYVVRHDHWTSEDERGFGEFITAIGESQCHVVNNCLHGAGNPFRASDSPDVYFESDCADLPYVYDREVAACKVAYTRSDGSTVNLTYEEARRRLFAMSFDPYHCVERRWAAGDPRELSTCGDGSTKQAWYSAEQNLRNQIDRTYDAEMDFTLEELRTPGPGKGTASPPDIDARAYLASVRGARPKVQKSAQAEPVGP